MRVPVEEGVMLPSRLPAPGAASFLPDTRECAAGYTCTLLAGTLCRSLAVLPCSLWLEQGLGDAAVEAVARSPVCRCRPSRRRGRPRPARPVPAPPAWLARPRIVRLLLPRAELGQRSCSLRTATLPGRAGPGLACSSPLEGAVRGRAR